MNRKLINDLTKVELEMAKKENKDILHNSILVNTERIKNDLEDNVDDLDIILNSIIQNENIEMSKRGGVKQCYIL